MEETVKLRPVEKKDLPLVSKMFKSEFGKPPYNDRWDLGELEGILEKQAERNSGLCFIIMLGEEPAGFILGLENHWWHTGKELFIEEMVIGEKFQGKGIGSKVLALVEKEIKPRGFESVSLIAYKKSKAMGFYTKHKFSERGFVYLKKDL